MSDIKLPPLPGQYSHVLTAAIHDYARQCVLADRAARSETVSEVNAAYAKGRADGWEAHAIAVEDATVASAVTIGMVIDEDSYGPSLHFQGHYLRGRTGWKVALIHPDVAPTQERGADDTPSPITFRSK